jgi:sugar phosphate isomerase/epimerase
MIEFSCHTWAFNDLTLTEALGTIARLGFRYADLGSGAHFNPVKAVADSRRVIADIVADLRVYNLKLADVYLLLPRITLADEDARRYEIEQFKALVPVMKGIGTAGVTLSPGMAVPNPNPDPDSNGDPAFERAVEALHEMIDSAGDDLSISIEPHLDSVAATPERALKLVEAVPGLSITLDWAQFVQQGYSDDDLAPLLPHTRHVQMRQAAKGKLQTAFAAGSIDLPAAMRTLQTADYRGVMCIEYLRSTQEVHGMIPVNVVRETVRLRDTLRTARK